MIDDDFLKNWNDKQANRSTRHHDGIYYKINADISGNIKIMATIRPEAAHIAMDIAKAFYQAAYDATNLITSQNIQKEKEREETKAQRIELNRCRRIALTVHRRTGSRRLAARCAPGMSHTWVMFIVADANKRQKEAHRSARNANMYRLNKQGLSIRAVASRYGLHHSTVHSIIKREARAI